jgi:hypothetical protein
VYESFDSSANKKKVLKSCYIVFSGKRQNTGHMAIRVGVFPFSDGSMAIRARVFHFADRNAIFFLP